MGARTSKLVEKGDIHAKPGSREWSVAVHLELVALIEKEQGDAKLLSRWLSKFKTHEGIKHITNRDDEPFESWADFCKEPLPYGLGYDAMVIDRVITEAKPPKLVIEQAAAKGPLAKPGEIGNGRSRGVINTSTQRGSTNREYLVRRLMRDAPEVYRKLQAGEFPSVRQAAIAAGIVKVPTALESLRKAWKKASTKERSAFLDEIGS